MSRRSLRPVALGCVLAACALAQGQPKVPQSFNDRYGLKPFTAFPEIRPPAPPEAKPENVEEFPRVVEDHFKAMHKRLLAGFPRPIPADAPPLVQVRTAQVNEGAAYLLQTWHVVAAGRWTPQDFYNLVKVVDDVYRAAAELEKTPADKAALFAERVAVFKDVERFTQARVDVGTDPPQQLNMARFS